jgi:hypothetical protein
VGECSTKGASFFLSEKEIIVNTITNQEWATIVVFSLLLVAGVSLIIEFISKKGKRQQASEFFYPETDYERAHKNVVRQLQFYQNIDNDVAREYQRLLDEAFELRQIIRKNRGQFTLWREGDPHPIINIEKWLGTRKIKGVRAKRIQEFLKRGIISEKQLSADGHLLNFIDQRRV